MREVRFSLTPTQETQILELLSNHGVYGKTKNGDLFGLSQRIRKFLLETAEWEKDAVLDVSGHLQEKEQQTQ